MKSDLETGTAVEKPPLKALVVIDSLLPGGAERSLLSLLPRLRKHGINPRLICLKRAPENLEKDAIELGFPPHYLLARKTSGKWYSKLPIWAWRLRKLVKKERPDLIHSTLFQASLACRIGLLGLNARHLSSIVNMDYSPERTGDPNIKGGRMLAQLKLKVILAINRFSSFLVPHFHAVTPAIKEETCNHLGVPRDRISVVFRGRSPAPFVSTEERLQLRDSLGISHETFIILNVGSQEYQKGQIFLIRALAKEALREKDLKLLIAGRKGAVSTELESEVRRLGLTSKVLLLGHRDDISQLLAAADIFALPSLFEGAAGALLEAMAARKPIVVSDLTELREVINKDCALRVPARSPEALAKAIEHLLLDKEFAQEMASNGKKLFEKNFLIENVAAKMAALYREVSEA